MVEREIAWREQEAERGDALGETPAAEFAGEESGEEHHGGAGEGRGQTDAGEPIAEESADDSSDEGDERGLIDVAPGEVLAAGEVIELVDEEAVLTAGV